MVFNVLSKRNDTPSFINGTPTSPILRQPPRGGGGEDGLAEAFEQGGDAGQAGVDGVYASEDRVEFVGDAFLLGHWCQWHF